MPQMSPLMWGLMFSIFSILMVLSFTKIYFNYCNSLTTSNNETSSKTLKLSLTWLW